MKNKKLLTIKLVTLITVLVLLCWFVFNGVTFFDREFRFFSGSRSNQLETINMEFTNIDDFNISLIEENVNFAYHDEDNIKLTYTGYDKDNITIKQNGSKLSIDKEITVIFFSLFSSHSSGDLLILLPKKHTDISYTIHTVSGNVEVDTSGKRGDFNSVSGNIKLRNSIPTLNLTSISGDIKTDLPAHKVSADTVSGRVEVTLAENDIDFDANTVSGSIRLKVLGNDYNVDFDSISGDFSCGFDLKNSTTNYIDVSSVSGDLDIYH